MKEYLNAFMLASIGLTSAIADPNPLSKESNIEATNASGGGILRQSILGNLL